LFLVFSDNGDFDTQPFKELEANLNGQGKQSGIRAREIHQDIMKQVDVVFWQKLTIDKSALGPIHNLSQRYVMV